MSYIPGLRSRWRRSLPASAYRRTRELDLDTHVLALCAQQVLCLAPLAVAMSAVLQRENGTPLSTLLAKFFALKGDSATAVQRQFGLPSSSISTTALVVSMLIAVVLSTSLGGVQQRAFELIWDQPREAGVRSYLRLLVWTGALAGYTAGLVVVTRWGRDLGHLYGANVLTSNVFEGVLTAGFYWWSQHWLLGGRVRWSLLLPGSVAVGVGTVVLVRISRDVVPGQIAWQVQAYGLVGGVFVLSVWLMVLSAVVFGGVLLGSLLAERRTGDLEHRVADRGDRAVDGVDG